MYSKQDVVTAESHLRRIINQNRAAMAQYEGFLKDYAEVDDILSQLPGKIRHPIMVPISNVAFMEGYIEQGNELTVLLGDNYFVKCTASHAQSILRRRIDFTKQKVEELNQEFGLIKSRIGLATQWLEVDGDEDDGYGEMAQGLSELKLPESTGRKGRIEVLSSTEHPEPSSGLDDARETELAKRRAKIRELEASGADLTDEQLAEVLGVPIPDFPGDQQPMLDESGVVEITEYFKPDGTVESYLTPKGGSNRPGKPVSQSMKPIIRETTLDEQDDRQIVPMLQSNTSLAQTPAEEAPKKVSKFKAMRQTQNR